MKKETKQLVRELRTNGWEVTPTNGGHLRAKHPAGRVAFFPSTPSDPRSILNTRADIRRIERKMETEYA